MTGEEVRQFSLFEHLREDDANDLAQRITVRSAERGDVLFRQGESAEHLVLLSRGQVKMERISRDGTATIVEVLGPGNVLAAANFLSREAYPVTAIALSSLTYATLPYEDFAECVHHHPDVALALLQYLALRLHRAYGAQRALGRSHIRLAEALLRVAAEASEERDGDRLVNLSQRDLAELAGMARETVTRHLRTWQTQGFVRLGVRSIRVHDIGELQKIIDEERGSPS